jgi:hypothetical protein
MKLYTIIFVCFVILGCTKELSINFTEPSKKIVLYPFVTNNRNIVIKMSAPAGILSNSFPVLNDATVVITDNDVPVDTVMINEKGRGISKIIPVPDHEYGFRATASGYPEAFCIAQLPKPVESFSVDTAYLSFHYSKYLRTRLRIKDDPNTTNYYRATLNKKSYHTIQIQTGEYPNIITYDSTHISISKPQLYANIPDIGFFYTSIGLYILAHDVVDFSDASGFRNELGSEIYFEGDEFYFPDDLFNGKETILDIIVGSEIRSSCPAKYMIELSSISEDYYLGVKSYAKYGTKEYTDLPVTEEVSIYSAVKGGYGFPLAYSSVIDSTFWMPQY